MAGTGRKLPRGISRLPQGTYRARLYVDGVQHTVGVFHTIGDARAALDIARSEKARGVFVSPAEKRRQRKATAADAKLKAAADARTVRQMVEAWTAWQERRGLKLGSVYTYARRLESHFLPEFGDRPVSAVTPEALAGWLEALEASHGIKTAAAVHQTVAALFRWSTGDATDLPVTFQPWLIASPVPPLAASRLRRAQRDIGIERNRTPASPEDIAQIADGMPESERLAVLLAGWCGLRLGEVLALRRRHVSTGPDSTAWIRVDAQVQARGSGVREETPKTSAGARSVPVPPHVATDLGSHLEVHAATGRDGLLFPRRGGGNQLHNPNTLRKHFNAALEAVNAPRIAGDDDRAPLEQFTFHGLRHTALTRLGQAGATTAELKAYAGHSDGASVERYQHAERSRLAALAGALSTGVHMNPHEGEA